MCCGNCGNSSVSLLDFREWAFGTTYAKNELVKYGELLYVSLQDTNAGNQPSISPSYWQQTSVSTLLTAILNALT